MHITLKHCCILLVVTRENMWQNLKARPLEALIYELLLRNMYFELFLATETSSAMENCCEGKESRSYLTYSISISWLPTIQRRKEQKISNRSIPIIFCRYFPISTQEGFMMTSSNGKKIPRYWPFVSGKHRWPVDSPHKGQWVTRNFNVFFNLLINKQLSK